MKSGHYYGLGTPQNLLFDLPLRFDFSLLQKDVILLQLLTNGCNPLTISCQILTNTCRTMLYRFLGQIFGILVFFCISLMKFSPVGRNHLAESLKRLRNDEVCAK